MFKVEHPLPDTRTDHPKAMDIVITSGLSQSQVAIDLTIVNPLRPSATLPAPESILILDKAASEKTHKYSLLCSQQGWKFIPVVFDVYGASHPNSRGVLKKIIKRLEAKCPVEEKAAAGRLVWSSVTTAVISRAAKQMERVSQADNPAGILLGALSWRKRKREPATQSDETGNTGIYHTQQPSSLFQSDSTL